MFSKLSTLKIISLTLLFLETLGLSLPVKASFDPIMIGAYEVDFKGNPSKKIKFSHTMFGGRDVIGLAVHVTGRKIDIDLCVGDELKEWSAAYSRIQQQHLQDGKAGCESGQGITMNIKNTLTDHLGYYKAGTSIQLTMGKEAVFYGTTAEAQEEIILTSPKMTFDTFFASGKSVVLQGPEDSSSWLQGMSFSKSLPCEKPFSFGFAGLLDFMAPAQATKENPFIVIGTNEITFHFENPDFNDGKTPDFIDGGKVVTN